MSNFWSSIFGRASGEPILEIDKAEYLTTKLNARPVIDLTNEEEKTLKIAIAALLAEVDACDKLMNEWMGSEQVAKDCEKHLKTAREKITKYNKEKSIDDLRSADELLEIRQRLIQAWYSKRSRPLVTFLFIFQLVILAACAFVLIHYGLLPGQTSSLGGGKLNINVIILLSSFMIGAVGGVFDGLYALKVHYSKRVFDEGYAFWYFSNAVLGGILGAVVFATILAGLLTTTGSGVAASANETLKAIPNAANTAGQTPTMAAFILVIAFIAGLKQTMVLKYLNRLAGGVFGTDSETKSGSSSS
jgi:exonuclease VII small subunit